MDRCGHCGKEGPDVVGLSIAETTPTTVEEWIATGGLAEQWGFCSLACFVVFVKARYIEDHRPGPDEALRLAGRREVAS